MRTRAAALLLALLASTALAADVEQTVKDSYGAFLQGRHEDAASGWRYLTGLGVTAPFPEANEALAWRDAGKPEAAAPLWIQASILDGADGFIWNQRAWSSLALGRTREAKEAFDKAIDRSSTTATQAEANFGEGLTALEDGRPKAALEPLRRAAIAGPYAISASAQLTAEASFAVGDRSAALGYLRQALDVDLDNREALRALTRLMDKIGDNRGAWLTSRRALALDPSDAASRKIMERNAKFIVGDPDEAYGVRRIPRPLLDPDDADFPPPASTRAIRVGLYGAPDGRPASMTHCYLMMNSPFKVTAAGYAGALRDNGNAFDQWEVEFRPETGVIEVRDSARNLLFTSKQSFTFVPASARGSVLIKSAVVTDAVGVDLGDRELRGRVEVIPNPWGFRLVQEVPLELYLYGVVSLALPDGSPPEAYKAQAVASRTAALWAVGHRAPTLERYDLLDDRSTQSSIGVSGEMRAAAVGVADTEGMVLVYGGQIARAPQCEDSGGRTEDGRESGEPGMESLVSVSDSRQELPPWRTPLDLERFVHQAPPEGLYSEAAPGPSAATGRWMRVLDAADLRARAEAKAGKRLGRLRGLRVAGRTAAGRVKALEAIGADGSVTFTGFSEIQGFLSPGSLRSTLFTFQPLYDGKNLSRVVVWGAGTGAGFGFSRSGAVGQAALGRGWREIVEHYFPQDQIRDAYRPPAAAAAPRKKGHGPYRRTLNYRSKRAPASTAK